MLAQVKTLGQELENLPQQFSKEWADRQIEWINLDIEDWGSRVGGKKKFQKVTRPHREIIEKLEAVKPTLPSDDQIEVEPPLFLMTTEYFKWLEACLEKINEPVEVVA